MVIKLDKVYMAGPRRVTPWTKFVVNLRNLYGVDPALLLTVIDKQTLSHYHFREYIQFEVNRYAIKSIQLTRFMEENSLGYPDICSCYGILGLNFVRLFSFGFRGKPIELFNPLIASRYIVQYIQKLSDIHHKDTLKSLVNWKYLGNIYKVASGFNFEKREAVLSESYAIWKRWIDEKVSSDGEILF